MANLPRPSGKDLVPFLERLGFAVIRVRGSHHFLECGDARTCVPVHANETLKIGTRGILRDIGLSPTEFENKWNED